MFSFSPLSPPRRPTSSRKLPRKDLSRNTQPLRVGFERPTVPTLDMSPSRNQTKQSRELRVADTELHGSAYLREVRRAGRPRFLPPSTNLERQLGPVRFPSGETPPTPIPKTGQGRGTATRARNMATAVGRLFPSSPAPAIYRHWAFPVTPLSSLPPIDARILPLPLDTVTSCALPSSPLFPKFRYESRHAAAPLTPAFPACLARAIPFSSIDTGIMGCFRFLKKYAFLWCYCSCPTGKADWLLGKTDARG